MGCTNSSALNYNSMATVDDASCSYPPEQIPDDFVFAQTCDPKFTEYVSQGDSGSEVTLWQQFLNFGFNEGIEETGYFGSQTFGGVKRFQEFFTGAILTPWGLTEGTGGVYETTRSWANRITGCAEGSLQIEGKTVNHASYAIPRGYEFLQTFGTPGATGFTTLETAPVSATVQPVTVITETIPETSSSNLGSSATGDAEIDMLLEAIMGIEERIESLNE